MVIRFMIYTNRHFSKVRTKVYINCTKCALSLSPYVILHQLWRSSALYLAFHIHNTNLGHECMGCQNLAYRLCNAGVNILSCHLDVNDIMPLLSAYDIMPGLKVAFDEKVGKK